MQAHGHYIEDLTPGMSVEWNKVITDEMVHVFAQLTGDHNPIHLDDDFAATTMFKQRIVHGAYVASFLSGVMGMELPGPGAVFRSLEMSYRGPVYIGDEITAIVTVDDVLAEKNIVSLKLACKARGKTVVRGKAGAWVANRPVS